MTQEMVPGAYITESGVPSNCVQISVYNHSHDGSDLRITHYFLIDSKFERPVLSAPLFGLWRYEGRGQCEHAVWFDKSVNGLPGNPHYLINFVWELAHGPLPRGSYVTPRNYDWLDCRLFNLKLITPREEDGRSLLPVKTVTPGLRLIDHSKDRVSARLDSTLH